MSVISKGVPDLPPEQQAIRDRCFHQTGSYVEFTQEEVEQSISAGFEKQVRLYPNQLAIKTTLEEITYDQLNRNTNQVAHAILGQTGIEYGPVALLFEQGIQAITGMLGVLKVGRAFVPLDQSFPLFRTTYMVEDVGSNLILTDSRNLSLATELASSGCLVIDIENLDPNLSIENIALHTTPDALAYVMYTSGSTGQPKGVTHSQRNLMHAAIRANNFRHVCSSDRLTMLYTPLSISGLIDIFRALLSGGTLYPLDLKIDGIGSLATWLSQNQITIYQSVPTVFRQFLSDLDVDDGFSDLRLIVLSGEPVLMTDVAQFKQKFSHNCILVNLFGTTEITNIRAYLIEHGTQIQGNMVPVGYDSSQSTDLLILDDDLKEVEFNSIGQIAVRSRYLSTGYWNNPDLTHTSFLDDPDGGDLRIFLTGDLGRMDEDGCLEHLGRMDFQVKVRGFRVELPEIENALIGLNTIKEAAVVAEKYKASENQKLIAYFVPIYQDTPPPGDLRNLLRGKLPDYMIPSVFVRMDSLPKLASGKIDRLALPKPTEDRPNLDSPFVPPRTPLEEELAKIWADVLDLDELGIDDNFLDLGGDSLRAGQVISRVIKIFRVDLPLRSLFEAPTVAEMALVITQNQAQKADQEQVERMLAGLEYLADERSKGIPVEETESTRTYGGRDEKPLDSSL